MEYLYKYLYPFLILLRRYLRYYYMQVTSIHFVSTIKIGKYTQENYLKNCLVYKCEQVQVTNNIVNEKKHL